MVGPKKITTLHVGRVCAGVKLYRLVPGDFLRLPLKRVHPLEQIDDERVATTSITIASGDRRNCDGEVSSTARLGSSRALINRDKCLQVRHLVVIASSWIIVKYFSKSNCRIAHYSSFAPRFRLLIGAFKTGTEQHSFRTFHQI